MSDDTGLLTRVENFLDAHERMAEPPLTLNAAIVFIKALRGELRATESERKHHEMTAGTLRTDLEYMTRERDQLLAQASERYQALVDAKERAARAEQAEARLAECVKALEPFADVAENDIGESEKNADFFRPMNPRNARAPALTVGDLRRAASAIRNRSAT